MRTFILVATFILCVSGSAVNGSGTPDPQAPVVFQYWQSDLDDVLYFYSSLAGRPVYVDAGVGGRVDVMSRRQLPRGEALPWVRKLLLEQYGIRIEDTSAQIRVSWSPDYPVQREATQRTMKPGLPSRVIDRAKKNSDAPPKA